MMGPYHYGAHQFGDWRQYAGLGRQQQAVAPPSSSGPVKPPENFSEFMGNKLGPMQSQVSNFAKAAGQALGGDFGSALTTMSGAQFGLPSPGAAQMPSPGVVQTPPMDNAYDYTSQLER